MSIIFYIFFSWEFSQRDFQIRTDEEVCHISEGIGKWHTFLILLMVKIGDKAEENWRVPIR